MDPAAESSDGSTEREEDRSSESSFSDAAGHSNTAASLPPRIRVQGQLEDQIKVDPNKQKQYLLVLARGVSNSGVKEKLINYKTIYLVLNLYSWIYQIVLFLSKTGQGLA